MHVTEWFVSLEKPQRNCKLDRLLIGLQHADPQFPMRIHTYSLTHDLQNSSVALKAVFQNKQKADLFLIALFLLSFFSDQSDPKAQRGLKED